MDSIQVIGNIFSRLIKVIKKFLLSLPLTILLTFSRNLLAATAVVDRESLLSHREKTLRTLSVRTMRGIAILTGIVTVKPEIVIESVATRGESTHPHILRIAEYI
jgi:hypothetical protein